MGSSAPQLRDSGVSGDGGRSWQQAVGSPAVVVLSWAGDGALFGVTSDGLVHRSADAGITWESRGDVGGPPEAVLVDDSGPTQMLFVGVSGVGIMASADGGYSFAIRYPA